VNHFKHLIRLDKMMNKPLSLSAARKAGKVTEFIAEREAEAANPGDEAAFNRALASMARTSKEAPEASKPERGDD
jgi:hypothetical protein